MKKAHAYIRTSSASSDSSTERQRARIEQLLKHKALNEIDRKGSRFMDMVDQIESGTFQPEVLIVSDLARIKKLYALEAARLFGVFQEYGIEMHTVTDGKIDLNSAPQEILELLSE